MKYSIILTGWLIYGVCYVYYWMFKAIFSGCKKLMSFIRSRISDKGAVMMKKEIKELSQSEEKSE